MEDFFDFYRHIPGIISPIAFSIGPFSVSWYSLMYLTGFITVYFLVSYRIRRGEITLNKSLFFDYFFYAFLGLIVGARLGYVLLYDFSHYLHNPLGIISPFDLNTGTFTGIYGLSFHGGLAGIILATFIFCRRYKLDFWDFSNFIAPAVPAGYFFGRIGNFMNGELYGRTTQKAWGMYFPDDKFGFLRHPSQLYEAAFEGILLFAFLWLLRKRVNFKNVMFPVFLIGYSLARISAEFFREPDSQIGLIFGYFTLGQIFSFVLLLAGLSLLWLEKNRKKC